MTAQNLANNVPHMSLCGSEKIVTECFVEDIRAVLLATLYIAYWSFHACHFHRNSVQRVGVQVD